MSHGVPGTNEPLAGSPRRAALLLALFAVVFLWTPITNSGTDVLVPAGSGAAHPLLRATDVRPGEAPSSPSHAAVNTSAEEAWRTSIPWQILSREKLTHGVLPTWNGSNGGGQPHLANPATATFSPFSLPLYVLGLKFGLLAAAFARLFLLGWFTFSFLRELRTSFEAAVVGAVAFMFGGHAIVGLLHPGSGAAVLLPAGLFLVERIARACERETSPRVGGAPDEDVRGSILRPTLWLAVALACGWFAGSVETFTVAVVTITAWAVLRSIVSAVRAVHQDGPGRAFAVVARAACAGLVAFGLGAMLSGIQAVPWLEFLRNASDASDPAEANRVTFAVFAWPLQVFPNMLGSPTGTFALAPDLPRPGYAEVTATYVGGLALFLAACGVVLARRRFETWFFAGVVVFGAACAHGLLATRDLLDALPPWVVDPVQHSSVAFAFGVAVLAALAVDRLGDRARPASNGAAFLAGAFGIAFLALSEVAAERLLVETLQARADPTERVLAHLSLDAQVAFVGAWTLLGVLAVMLALATRSITWRVRAGYVIAVSCFVTTGWLLRDTNTTTDEEHVYARTELVQAFGTATSGRNVLWLGESGLPPGVNVVYPLRSQAVPGPLRIRRHDHLQRTLFDPRGPERVVTHTTEHALQIFGIEVVIDADRWIDVDTELGGLPAVDSLWFDTDEILPGSEVTQRFAAFRDHPQALQLLFRTRGGRNPFTLVIGLEDARTHERFFEHRFAPGDIRPRGESLATVSVPLPADAIPAGRPLVMRVEAPDALPGTGWSLRWRADVDEHLRQLCARGVADAAAPGGRRVLRADLWQASQGDHKLDGQLVMDLHHAYGAFAQETRIGPYNVCAHKNWSARFRTVASASVQPNASASFAAVIDPTFDPRQNVVLEAVDPALARHGAIEGEQDTLVDVIEDVDGHARVVVKRPTPGFLVAPISWYPGWTAEVNKEPVPVMCANHAFTAVAVPAGESLVDFDYRPRSVRRGITWSLLGLVGLAVGFAYASSTSRAGKRSQR